MRFLDISKKDSSQHDQWWKFGNPLLQRPLLFFFLLLVVTFSAIGWQNQRQKTQIIENLALQSAEDISTTLAQFRTLYSKTFISRVEPMGMPVTDNSSVQDNAFPLPEALRKLLNKRLKTHGHGVQSRLYGPYSTGQTPNQGLNDKFVKDAWQALGQNPDQPFYRVETVNGQSILRLARTDAVQAVCIDCPANPADTRKAGSNAEKLRAMLEVIVPLGAAFAKDDTGTIKSTSLMVVSALLMLSFLGVILHNLYKEKSRTETLADEAYQADILKTEFLSTTSHELRTPLTAISGSLSIVLSGALGELPQKVKKLLVMAQNNSSRLMVLVNDILDINKMIAGEMAFNIEPHELVNLIKTAIDNNRGYGESYNIKFRCDPIEENMLVEVDFNRFQQVMSNLMSNAAKFSPVGRDVLIAVSPHGEYHRISVTDNGPGIPKDFQNRVFDRFSQADSSDAKQTGGTGLGLRISKMIVEEFGGTIGFETEEGVGTTFFFDLHAYQIENPQTQAIAT